MNQQKSIAIAVRSQQRRLVWAVAVLLLCTSCISTSSIPDGDQLFVGLEKIRYDEDSLKHSPASKRHLDETKADIEAALATAPNGALFGSSYYRVPFSWRLWVYNKYGGKESKFARWMTKSFGKPPVLMSNVNPALRASVAQSVLKSNGYFRANVGYEAVVKKNPKKGKIAYHIHLDTLFTYDSVQYVGYQSLPRQLIDSTRHEALVRRDEPFSVTTLEGERSRVSTLLRNNGYYYYNNGYASYLADTMAVPGRVQLRFQLADGLPADALSRWYVGNISVLFRHSFREQLTDSLQRRHMTFYFNGKKSPVRPRVALKGLRLFPGQLFSYEKYQESVSQMNSGGIFSSMDFQFTPRPLTDTLDLAINCVFEKPYDFYVETNVVGRTIGRYGPELKVGFTKRNAFHGGEKLDVNLHGNYEWQKNTINSELGNMNSYIYGADASVEFPRILAPFVKDRPRRRRQPGTQPTAFTRQRSTLAKVSTDIIRRPSYYKMHIVTGEWTYRWQNSAQHRHELSPLTLKYQYMNTRTELFDSILTSNAYTQASMEDNFIPKMRYTYTYTSPTTLLHPVRWETTIEQAGNVTALYDVLVQGHGWNQTGKTLFKNPYAQFVRVETDLTKTWTLTPSATLVGHLNAGFIHCYGNSREAPFSELFYAGGANSIRAFSVRGIGPGRLSFNSEDDRQMSYLLRNGDLKFVANLEYRPRLFGNLEGALFIDVGNVWLRQLDYDDPGELSKEGFTDEEIKLYQLLFDYIKDESVFKASRFLDQLAVGTGVGLRYNLGFLAIRLDWGLALHLPYKTTRSGYFNVDRFKSAQTLHFAIGYPF